MLRVGLVIFLACIAAGAGLAGAPPRGTIWKGDFATGNLAQYSQDVQCAAADRATVITAPVRGGRFAVRFHVEPGDVVFTEGSDRCELYTLRPETLGTEGREQWWAWSTFFPSDFHPTPRSNWNVVQQFHSTKPFGANTMVTVNTIGRRPMLQFSVFGGDPSKPHKLRQNVAPLVRNRWYDFVFHVRWSSDPTRAFVQLWINGKLVFPLRRLATLYPGKTAYFKLGNYRLTSSAASSVIHDEARLARTRAALGARPPRR
jgi:hypothetical protein